MPIFALRTGDFVLFGGDYHEIISIEIWGNETYINTIGDDDPIEYNTGDIVVAIQKAKVA